jgi:hypothetical protein
MLLLEVLQDSCTLLRNSVKACKNVVSKLVLKLVSVSILECSVDYLKLDVNWITQVEGSPPYCLLC